MKILIIEDNDILRNNIIKFLEIKGCEAEWHNEAHGAVYKIMTWNYDGVILDIWLGDLEQNGLDICHEIREKWNNIPILFLTARTLTDQKIEGLEAGADDYIVKPFDYEELLARVKSMSRRNNTLKWNKLAFWNIEIYEDQMLVKQSDKEISLSKLEFSLLLYLAQNRGRALTKEQITEKVWWEIDLFKESRSLDIYVGYLRKKLGKDIVETVRWVGYMIP